MASLKATLAKAVTSAFTAVGDIKQTVTYRRTTSTYNPHTGTNTTTNVDYTLSVILTSFNNIEIDKVTVLAFDRKMIVQTKDLTLTPSMATDKVIINGKVHNVIQVKQDPALATYTLQLRAP